MKPATAFCAIMTAWTEISPSPHHPAGKINLSSAQPSERHSEKNQKEFLRIALRAARSSKYPNPWKNKAVGINAYLKIVCNRLKLHLRDFSGCRYKLDTRTSKKRLNLGTSLTYVWLTPSFHCTAHKRPVCLPHGDKNLGKGTCVGIQGIAC